MTDTAIQVGIGGTVALLLVKEVFSFVKSRRDSWNGDERRGSIDDRRGGTIGEQSTDYLRETAKAAVEEVMAASVLPIMAQLTDILGRLELRSSAAYETDLKNSFTLHEVQVSTERVRTTLHTINDGIQRLASEGQRRSTS